MSYVNHFDAESAGTTTAGIESASRRMTRKQCGGRVLTSAALSSGPGVAAQGRRRLSACSRPCRRLLFARVLTGYVLGQLRTVDSGHRVGQSEVDARAMLLLVSQRVPTAMRAAHPDEDHCATICDGRIRLPLATCSCRLSFWLLRDSTCGGGDLAAVSPSPGYACGSAER